MRINIAKFSLNSGNVILPKFAKKGVLQKNQKLSVRYPWMAAKEVAVFTDYPTTFLELEGTRITAALDIARKFGLVTNDLLPFRLPDLNQKWQMKDSMSVEVCKISIQRPQI
jgi:hypothetical protein